MSCEYAVKTNTEGLVSCQLIKDLSGKKATVSEVNKCSVCPKNDSGQITINVNSLLKIRLRSQWKKEPDLVALTDALQKRLGSDVTRAEILKAIENGLPVKTALDLEAKL